MQGTDRSYSLDQGVDPRNQRAEQRYGSQIVSCYVFNSKINQTLPRFNVPFK